MARTSDSVRGVTSRAKQTDVAHGPGPGWFRFVLAVAALTYYLLITCVDHQSKLKAKLPAAITYFTQETELFANADRYVLDFHTDAWSCERRQWEPLDPRPYFPLHAGDKENRLFRVLTMYLKEPGKHSHWFRPVARALERYIVEHHAAGGDDGVAGPIGGVRFTRTFTAFGWPGDDVPRYEYRPLDPLPWGLHKEQAYETPAPHLQGQCDAGGHGVDYPPGPDEDVR
jgi:hypothetical protein